MADMWLMVSEGAGGPTIPARSGGSDRAQPSLKQDPQRGASRPGLDSFKNETLGGLAPPLTFTAGKPHPINCYFEGRISHGTPVLENNGKPTCVNVW
jgi:branched-chain amino acid transport system substrate-binding protein